jgi:VIT1/CCC1 family predicted Fe2+/Mn2+ transporter
MTEGSVATTSSAQQSADSDAPAVPSIDSLPSKDNQPSVAAQQPGESSDDAASVAAAVYSADEKTEADQTAGEAATDPSTASNSDSDDGGDTIPVSVKRYRWTPPNDAARFPYRPHQGEGSQYLRDFILGVNDGLISTFLVVVGVVGGNASTLQALLTGISSAIAGALSMGIGEYIATKSQLQVNEGEKRLENEHFKYHRDVELEQLRQFLSSVNLSGNLLEAVVSEVGRSDDGLMRMMQAFEFGGEEELERNPLRAMWMSGRLFFLGSLPTVIPFFFSISPGTAVAIAAALVGVSLFIVGAYKTRTTRGNWLLDGLENLALGAVGAGIAYGVGVAFDKAS